MRVNAQLYTYTKKRVWVHDEILVEMDIILNSNSQIWFLLLRKAVIRKFVVQIVQFIIIDKSVHWNAANSNEWCVCVFALHAVIWARNFVEENALMNLNKKKDGEKNANHFNSSCDTHTHRLTWLVDLIWIKNGKCYTLTLSLSLALALDHNSVFGLNKLQDYLCVQHAKARP